MPEDKERGFLDAAGAAFLRRRLHNRRMRAAAVRGLKEVSAGVAGGLRMDFDPKADCFTHVPPWMTAYGNEMARTAAQAGAVKRVPPLSIVIMIVGTRGDVQPFIPIGLRLKSDGHRVRVATHREFRPVIEKAELEFYPLAGDPHALIEYMVKTGGRIVPLRPDHIIEDVPKKRAMIAEILASTWPACTAPDPEKPNAPAFRADFIIANPPSYGHLHCAERLHVPLHMIFTMPWSPTSAFPHPLARLDPSADRPVQNYLSYAIADLLTWSGIGDLINDFREETLALPPISMVDGPALLEAHEVPFTYLWPASLVPRPADWGPHIDLSNFIFYDQAHTYQPPQDLLDFLAAGEKPIYVGFGSAVVPDSAAVSRTIFAALEKAGARGVVSEGWGNLGHESPPPNVYLIGDAPHDWLFRHCRAVCHHGGAGTTAAGLRAGLPTVVVPFFGDQFFWGQVIADAGAGPQPIPIDDLESEALADAFTLCARPEVRECAEALGEKVRDTDGVELTAQSVYRHLPVEAMLCEAGPEHLASLYCETCRKRLCQEHADRDHAGHHVCPYRFIDWGARPERGLMDGLGELISDAAKALQAGLEEIMPQLSPRRHGVIFSDTEEASDGARAEGPVRKLQRWLGSL
jgi:UDP:flavonoid glycosyltransferase YjiC (YdhE family)